MDAKIRLYRIATSEDPNNSYVDTPERATAQLGDLMKDAQEGEGYLITVTHMTRGEFEALEEFMGF